MSDFTHAASDDPDPVVLVVDDTDAVREVVCAMLRRHGFEVRVAANGRDSLDVYHELVQRGHDVTVLLDVQMPGLDGPLVLAALQATDPGVRAYFMPGPVLRGRPPGAGCRAGVRQAARPSRHGGRTPPGRESRGPCGPGDRLGGLTTVSFREDLR
jgi:CheY-like chemotaxis protein